MKPKYLLVIINGAGDEMCNKEFSTLKEARKHSKIFSSFNSIKIWKLVYENPDYVQLYR